MKTQSAQTAAAIRAELKKTFPEIKFSVTSETYSMGSSVNISYIDGVTTKQVEAVVKKYQYGHFDSMIDCYEVSNNRKDIPQVKFVMVRREKSDEAKALLMAELHEIHPASKDLEYNDYFKEMNEDMYTLVHRLFCQRDFSQTWWEKILVE